jgi:non-lysosomal glucosylceramidase
MWPLVKIVIVTIQEQDNDGDGLIDSTGRPDQTYDAWSVTGASAYVGGLHIAVLQACVEMAKVLEDQDSYKKYFEIYERAKKAYNEKLWNGSYYNYDSSNNHYKDSVMADMCCGHWYLRSSGFKYEVIFMINLN